MADTAKKQPDGGAAEVQKSFDKINAKGYAGNVPEQPANAEYTLQTGPDSPTSDGTVRADVRDLKEKN